MDECAAYLREEEKCSKAALEMHVVALRFLRDRLQVGDDNGLSAVLLDSSADSHLTTANTKLASGIILLSRTVVLIFVIAGLVRVNS